MTGSAIETRPLDRIGEYHWAEELQRRVWGFIDVEVIPLHVLLTAQKNGGLTLGAFDTRLSGEASLLAVAFGFSGLDALGPKHHSHVVGVSPSARGRGIGALLKWYQRACVLDAGQRRITWTYDPLMAGNARFNLRKLGAVAHRYAEDIYGEIRDDLNRGLPTDRLILDWWLDDPVVAARASGGATASDEDLAYVPEATASRPAKSGSWRVPVGWSLSDAERVRVEIPIDALALKRDDIEAARAWRHVIRDAFTALFARGYVAIDAYAVDGRAFYVLATDAYRARRPRVAREAP